jgi:Uncharacterized conserved protein
VKIEILFIGKTKEKWIEEGIEMFRKRLTGRVSIDLLPRKDFQSLKGIEDQAIYLDPQGKMYDSHEFHTFLFKTIETTKRVIFVIGGAEGFPKELQNVGTRISLSKMTFTHEMALLFLSEQIYRSFEIEKNSGYHK